jgi:hypothetical protein
MSADEGEQLLQRINEARDRVSACEGATLRSELIAVGRMYTVFTTNERELRRLFDVYDDVQATLELWDADHPERFDAFLAETERLLHNYLAAASSLADHTMRLWKKYPPKDAELTEGHKRKVEETFVDSPLANFVQGLRNLSTHRRLPLVQGTMSWTTTGENAGMTVVTSLDKDALLAWDGWKAGAKTYLDEADMIDLEKVVADYTQSVHDFNQWFGEAFVQGPSACV